MANAQRARWKQTTSPLARLGRRLWLRLRGDGLPTYFAPEYRPPLAGTEAMTGFEPRRAEMVLTYLLDRGFLAPADVRRPQRARLDELERVHPADHLFALSSAEALGRVFAVDPAEVPVDALLHTLRLGVGGTVAAAREAFRRRGPTLNLFGGFHHAGPASAGGFSVLNDVAVAIAALRADGFGGRVVVLDLDAHPPDGTAAAIADDPRCHIASLSGADWALPPRVDETLLPAGCDDATYLAALDALLHRVGAVDLAFVLAGGDVLAGDRLGALGLSLAGAAERDLRVARLLADTPSVWLPAGGYHDDAWRLLATTATILITGAPHPPAADYDPVRVAVRRIAGALTPHLAAGGRDHAAAGRDDPLADVFAPGDLDELFGGAPRAPRLLGYYSAEMLELALHRYGVLAVIRALGYVEPRVSIEAHETGERFVLRARAAGAQHVLVEAILDRVRHGDAELLYVNWLTLRHPRARFGRHRRPLPGQDVPGLGMAKEAGELLAQMALRLGLAGVAFRPAALHVAYAARYEFRFVDPARQAAFEALLRDLGAMGIGALTRAVAAGEVRCNGEPYRWQSELMVCWLDAARAPSADDVSRAAAALRFEHAPPRASDPPR